MRVCKRKRRVSLEEMLEFVVCMKRRRRGGATLRDDATSLLFGSPSFCSADSGRKSFPARHGRRHVKTLRPAKQARLNDCTQPHWPSSIPGCFRRNESLLDNLAFHTFFRLPIVFLSTIQSRRIDDGLACKAWTQPRSGLSPSANSGARRCQKRRKAHAELPNLNRHLSHQVDHRKHRRMLRHPETSLDTRMKATRSLRAGHSMI